jgi:phosphoribosylformylglycinamidine cyclo-ligase
VRKILARAQPDLGLAFDGERTLGDAIMAPTRIYVQPLLALLRALPVKGMAHITGGGLTGNVPRILPAHVKAEIVQAAWPRPKLFEWLQREGGVAESEMHRVFNCGIGMVVVVARECVQQATQILRDAGEPALVIGSIKARREDEAPTTVV